jgi:hypothetical protein
MKNFLAIGLACCIPIGLAAEDSNRVEAWLGTMPVLVVDESAPARIEQSCARAAREDPVVPCISFDRAVLTARIQRVSVLHERGRWM